MRVVKSVNTYVRLVDHIEVIIRLLSIPLCDSPQIVYGVQLDIYKMVMELGQYFNPSHRSYVRLVTMNNMTTIVLDLCVLRCKLLEFYATYYTINESVSCDDQLEIIDTCIEVLERKMR